MRCPYCNHITDDDSMFCASCGRKIEPRGNTYQHTTEMPKMSLYEDDFDMEEERKGKSSSSSVPVIIAIIIAIITGTELEEDFPFRSSSISKSSSYNDIFGISVVC